MPQGPPNPGFMREKVQKGDFLKKPSRDLKFFCCFRFLRISRRPGTLNWKWLVFLLSKILYKKCVAIAEFLCKMQRKTWYSIFGVDHVSFPQKPVVKRHFACCTIDNCKYVLRSKYSRPEKHHQIFLLIIYLEPSFFVAAFVKNKLHQQKQIDFYKLFSTNSGPL